MPNDVIGLNNDQLMERLRLQISILFQAGENEDSAKDAAVSEWVAIDKELARRLSTLRAEVERLKAELAKRPSEADVAVMRELCEADLAVVDENHETEESFEAAGYNRHLARDAYRAMKGGVDA